MSWLNTRKTFGPLPTDIANKIRFGMRAPVALERIWVDPKKISWAIAHPAEIGLNNESSEYAFYEHFHIQAEQSVGRVVCAKEYEPALVPLERVKKIDACLMHWVHGLSWEEAGAIDNLLFKIKVTGRPQSGCHTHSDVISRYRKLDDIFEAVRVSGSLSSKLSRGRLIRRERDGINIHLGHDGMPIFGSSGTHRLAMAIALGLDRIPASLGFVDKSALPYLKKLRR
ncbi:MAG: hypothetical protein JJU24_11005 [Natronohydrobacter sp.]|nr:hypothetical protein [Natronohydrobacter sp.]